MRYSTGSGLLQQGEGSRAGRRAGEPLAAAEHRAWGWISPLLTCRRFLAPNHVTSSVLLGKPEVLEFCISELVFMLPLNHV